MGPGIILAWVQISKQCLIEIKQRKLNNPKRAILMRQEKSRQAENSPIQ